uniref:Putative ovule protein n=1 Tax=Solanum chacoense TaxID=4108 RepID=A0A0V0HTV7_SOLCH
MMTSQSLQLSYSRKIVELTDRLLAKEHHKASYMLSPNSRLFLPEKIEVPLKRPYMLKSNELFL